MKHMNVIWLNGMPRSGTSWLGQLFDSHPETRYRLAPLFSYRFKNYLSESSSREECQEFIYMVYHCLGDEFMEQLEMKRKGHYPVFEQKCAKPSHLVMKHTRFHNLTNMILENMPNLKLIHIVRHPCAAIYSWLKTPNEFPPEDDPYEYWRNGKNRKTSKEEFWGFNDWIKLTRYYQQLALKEPEKVMLIKYEDLVKNARELVREMFTFCGFNEVPEQTVSFLHESQKSKSDNKYSVYRGKNNVLNKWEKGLPYKIKKSIFNELTETDLEKYLTN